jgi:hypothetical protein
VCLVAYAAYLVVQLSPGIRQWLGVA